MICTDAAAEGINLQFCWIMINFDVPWNPARLEQRMGRIHRYGQKHDPVQIVNLVAPKTREGLVIQTLLNKLETIRDSLGTEKVFDSIGRLFEGVSLKQYMEQAVLEGAETVAHELEGRLTKEQVVALAAKEKMLFGDGGDVARQLPRLRDDLEQEAYCRLLPGYVRHFVENAAPLVGIQIEGNLDGCFSFRPATSGAVDPLVHTLEMYPAKQRNCLTVVRPEKKDQAIWVHPGEPVFERFRAVVSDRLGDQALRGAVFVDPTADKPYLFHLALVSVVRQADPEMPDLAERRGAGLPARGRQAVRGGRGGSVPGRTSAAAQGRARSAAGGTAAGADRRQAQGPGRGVHGRTRRPQHGDRTSPDADGHAARARAVRPARV